MAAQFQLVSALIAKAVRRADVEGQDDRHTPVALLEDFNDSAQQMRTRLSNLGFEWFLRDTTPGNLSTTPPQTDETFTEEAWPVDAQRIYRVDVLMQPGLWLPLRAISLSNIRDYQLFRNVWDDFGFNTAGAPCAWALKEAPFGAAAVETAGKIIITPKPTQTRKFKMFYLQNWASVASTATINGHAGFLEWIVWDMVCKLSIRDNDSNQTYAGAAAERAKIEGMFALEAPKTQQANADVPRRMDDPWDDWSGGPRMV